MIDIDSLQKQISRDRTKISTLMDNIEINQIIEKNITDATHAQYASVWMYNAKSLLREREYGEVREISLSAKDGLLYKCFATKKAKIYNNLKSEKGYREEIDNPDGIKMKSKILIPLTVDDKFIGIATAYSSVEQIKNFTKMDLEVLDAIVPFIIDTVYKMQANNRHNYLVDRRKGNKDNGNRRRRDDVISNLEGLKLLTTQTRTPQEILETMSNLVHDIRTPSNGLFGFLEILEEQVGDARLKEYITHAKNSASLINKLTTSILDGISTKHEFLKSELESVNPFNFFAKIGGLFSANMYKKGIHYNIFIDPLLPKEIELHSVQLKRIIINLIGNAAKFTPEHGSIEFSVRYKQKEQGLHIFVKDSGIGIAEEKQKKIFEAFNQADDNTKKLFGGTGLGLSISAENVKELGGELLLESKIDKGSIFYFDIPINIKDNTLKFELINDENIHITILINKINYQIASSMLINFVKFGIDVKNIDIITNAKQISKDTTHMVVFERKLSDSIFTYADKHNIKLLVVEENFLSLGMDEIHGASLVSQYSYFGEALYSFINIRKTPRILIVEDDDISIVLLKAMLKDEDCEIDVANDGQKGLDLLKTALRNNDPYSLVYTDINMPLLSGDKMLELYKSLIDEKCTEILKTACISGNITKGEESPYDFDFFATKPFKKQEILSIFSNSLKCF